VGVVRVTGAISTFWTSKILPQQVVGIQVIFTTRPWSVCYDTYKTMEATRSRQGWVHMSITHRPTVTLQLHNFDLFRTCRTNSFCTVAWQLARFQLTRRIARSLCDSWASCKWNCQPGLEPCRPTRDSMTRQLSAVNVGSRVSQPIYTVSQKTRHQTLAHNFPKC